MSNDNENSLPAAKRRPPALGRGLSALFGENGGDSAALLAATAPAGLADTGVAADIRSVPIARISAHPDQPRRMFNEAQLAELAESIAARGVLQPILVRPLASGGYQLVAGERRWRAAQAAGLHDIPAIIRDLSDSDTLEIALIENVQRADLNAIEEAQALQALIDNFGHKQDDLAKLIGKSRSHIANLLRLLVLDPLVQTALIDGRITMGHGRALINAPNSAALLEKIIRGGLSVRATEALVRKAQGRIEVKSSAGLAKNASDGQKDPDIVALQDHLNDLLGIKSDIRHDIVGGNGTLTLHYSTIDQLDWLCQRLSGEKI